MFNPLQFYQFGGSEQVSSYILDLYPQIIGYSFRKLRTIPTLGIRVRRSSDNAETDILLPSSGIIDGSSILSVGGDLSTWKGASSLFVVTLYNQGTGGSTYDLTQSTASKQPQIANTSTIFDYIDFDGGSFILKAIAPVAHQTGTIFSLWETTTNNVVSLAQASAVSNSIYEMQHLFNNASYNYSCRSVTVAPNVLLAGSSDLRNTRKVVSVSSDNSRTLHSIDGVASSIMSAIVGSDVGGWFGDFSSTGYVLQMGGFERATPAYGGGKFCENILTDSELNETTTQIINSDIKTFYSV